jgi:hypothetical protein
MILGLEIAMIVMGIIALIRGEMKFSANKYVYGTAARLLGILALLPLPIAFCIGFVVGATEAVNNPNVNQAEFMEKHRTTLVITEVVIVLGTALLLFTIGFLIGEPPLSKRPKRRRRRRDEEEFDDEDERPRSRRRREEDENDIEEEPRRRRNRDDDDDDFDRKPRRGRRDEP